MTDAEREALARRYVEIERKLLDLTEGRTVIGDPAVVESMLRAEQREISVKLGWGSTPEPEDP
jgi:hypothetical protein